MKKKPRNQKSSTIIGAIPSRKDRPMKRLYTVPELLRLTGITRKQVSYWAQIKLLNPRMREPNARAGAPSSFYAPEEVVKALVICDLKRAGFSLRQIQQVVHNLEGYGIRLDGSENYLLTDGYSVYYANSDDEAVDILKHHRQMLLLVPVHEQVEKLKRIV
jgi:DNA-binding transcriptional MerR regulator